MVGIKRVCIIYIYVSNKHTYTRNTYINHLERNTSYWSNRISISCYILLYYVTWARANQIEFDFHITHTHTNIYI